MECIAVGVVKGDTLKLHRLLQGLSTTCVELASREFVLTSSVPGADGVFPQLRLQQHYKAVGDNPHFGVLPATTPLPPSMDQDASKWVLRHEGAHIFRNKALKELEVTARPVTSSVCCAAPAGVLDFWVQSGFSKDAQMYKEGNQYWCRFNGHELNVRFTQVFDGPSGAPRKSLMKHALLEVSGSTASEDMDDVLELARAIVEFGKTLSPFVTLRRAHNMKA